MNWLLAGRVAMIRVLAFSAVVIALFTLLACSGPQEPAPEPRAKGEKSKADLLIGKWKLVKRTPPMKPFVPMTFEYRVDGTCVLIKKNPLAGC